MVRDFQSVIGRETRVQLEKAEGRLPDTLVACIGGGWNGRGRGPPRGGGRVRLGEGGPPSDPHRTPALSAPGGGEGEDPRY
jgi:hypothetical protein